MSIIGLPIGLYGYLFPGNINIMVLDLYASKKYQTLLMVLSLIVLFESIYCICTLVFLGELTTTGSMYSWVEISSSILILIMGLIMLIEKSNNKKALQKNTLYRGIFNIIFHPQQIPFWLFIGVVFKPLEKFEMNYFTIAAFIFFNAVGTIMAMFVYMFFGNKLLQFFKLNISHLNKAMGVVYLLIGGYYLVIHIFGYPQ
jgi:small neutral amino acid transporter SnatA (MarC family)